MHQKLSNGICYGISSRAVYVTDRDLSVAYLRQHPLPEDDMLGAQGRAILLDDISEVRLYDNPKRTVRVCSGKRSSGKRPSGKRFLEINLRSEEKQILFARAIAEATGAPFRTRFIRFASLYTAGRFLLAGLLVLTLAWWAATVFNGTLSGPLAMLDGRIASLVVRGVQLAGLVSGIWLLVRGVEKLRSVGRVMVYRRLES